MRINKMKCYELDKPTIYCYYHNHTGCPEDCRWLMKTLDKLNLEELTNINEAKEFLTGNN